MDFAIANHGSLVTILPLTAEAQEWLDENVAAEAWQWLGGALAVDWRHASDLYDGILSDGLTLG